MLDTIPSTQNIVFTPKKESTTNTPTTNNNLVSPSAKQPLGNNKRVALANITNTANQRRKSPVAKKPLNKKALSSPVSPKPQQQSQQPQTPVKTPQLTTGSLSLTPAFEGSVPVAQQQTPRGSGIKYDLDFLRSFKESPVCQVAPTNVEGKTPMDIINQYNEEFRQRESLEREREKSEYILARFLDMSLNSPNKKQVWRPKRSAPASPPSLIGEDGASESTEFSCVSAPPSIKVTKPSVSFAVPVSSVVAAPSTPARKSVGVATISASAEEPEMETESEEKEPVDLERRVASRAKQVSYGKNTMGYSNYLTLVPKEKRKRTDPTTPDPKQNCSKRSFDGQVRKWRRALHQYDENRTPSEDQVGSNVCRRINFDAVEQTTITA